MSTYGTINQSPGRKDRRSGGPKRSQSHDAEHDRLLHSSHSQDGESRSERFDSKHEPFRHHDHMRLQDDQTTGPLGFMNPTRARFSYSANTTNPDSEGDNFNRLEGVPSGDAGEDFSAKNADIDYEWTSRDNRKGRHPLVVHEDAEYGSKHNYPRSTTTAKQVLAGIWRMFTVFPIHDISYLLAIDFLIASTIFTIVGVFSYLPHVNPDFELVGSRANVQAILGGVGSTLFLVGSTMSLFEAFNANRQGCIGWKMQHSSSGYQSSEESGNVAYLLPDDKCEHHHNGNRTDSSQPNPTEQDAQPWIWLPSWRDFRTYFLHDIGFITSLILSASSLIYTVSSWAACITTLTTSTVPPAIRPPQILAATGFLTATTLSLLETQRTWWKPAVERIGWWACLCNVLGSVGFLLTGVYGYVLFLRGERWMGFQFGSSFLGGSVCFWVGSVLQWFEALDKFPVERRQGRGKKG